MVFTYEIHVNLNHANQRSYVILNFGGVIGMLTESEIEKTHLSRRRRLE